MVATAANFKICFRHLLANHSAIEVKTYDEATCRPVDKKIANVVLIGNQK